jgi:hypothetical protein
LLVGAGDGDSASQVDVPTSVKNSCSRSSMLFSTRALLVKCHVTWYVTLQRQEQQKVVGWRTEKKATASQVNLHTTVSYSCSRALCTLCRIQMQSLQRQQLLTLLLPAHYFLPSQK